MSSLAKYYRKLHNDLFRSFSGLIGNYDEKKVHEMRLVYKRIRLINQFISKELDGKGLFNHQISKLDHIFAFSGMAREIHVSLKLINTYVKSLGQSYDEFGAFLDTKNTEVDSTLKNLIAETDIDAIRKAGKKIYRYLEEFSDKKIYRKSVRFIKRKIKRIKSLAHVCIENKRYHAIRTNIKDVFYFLKLFFTNKDLQELDLDKDRLKNIDVNLGKWHDLEVLQENLKDFFAINHITDYNAQDSKYTPILDHIRIIQNHLLAQIDKKIIKANLDMRYIIENE